MLCAELQIQIGPFILQLSQQDRILYCPEFGLLSYISEATTDFFLSWSLYAVTVSTFFHGKNVAA
jgi:hypothetical protein